MANVLENSDIVVQETLMHFVNNLSLFKKVDRQWEDKFAKEGAKAGDSISLREPVNFDVREGEAFSEQALQDRIITFSVDQRIGIDFAYSSAEKTLNLDRVAERYLEPAGRRLANEVDLRIARTMARECTLYTGTPGTAITSVSTFQTACTRLLQLGVPKGLRHAVVTPATMQAVVTDLRGLIEPGSTVAKQNKDGFMYNAFGMKWDIDQNLYVHTTGANTGSGLVKGANQSGASLLTDDFTNSSAAFKQGDKLQLPGAYAVNPITGAQLDHLRIFTVTADVTADGSGNATVPIAPAIVLSGPYKNVSAAPDDDGAIQLYGASGSTNAAKTSPANLVFHPGACAVAVIGLAAPEAGASSKYMSDEDAGVSMRVVRQYDINTDKNKVRFDIMFGIKVQLKDFCCVVAA